MLLDRLEALPVGRFHYKLLFGHRFGLLFDSMDTGLIAFILPRPCQRMGIGPGADGPHRQHRTHRYGPMPSYPVRLSTAWAARKSLRLRY